MLKFYAEAKGTKNETKKVGIWLNDFFFQVRINFNINISKLSWFIIRIQHDVNISFFSWLSVCFLFFFCLFVCFFLLDVNECTSATHKCHANADCVNTHGSYNCTCKAGYTGDGRNCSGEINNVNVQIMITRQGLFFDIPWMSLTEHFQGWYLLCAATSSGILMAKLPGRKPLVIKTISI